MSRKLLSCSGGDIVLPDKKLVLVDRQDGGNLIVTPPREVWDRSELSPFELTVWSFLVAATGKAMLEVLPQLGGGCLNYWDAGNWALNEQAEPFGLKNGKEHRKTHLHLLGRSRTAADISWRWGEAPNFPDFVERYVWASKNERLTAGECQSIIKRVKNILNEYYKMPEAKISPWSDCMICGYPVPNETSATATVCAECQSI